jgi:hypothetical protein
VRNVQKVLVGKTEGKRPLGRPRLRGISGKTGLGLGMNSASSEYGAVAGPFEHGDKVAGSIIYGEFQDFLSVLLASEEGPCSVGLHKVQGFKMERNRITN